MCSLRLIAAISAGIGGVCTILMMVQIVVDVLSRWIFGAPVTGTMEIVAVYYLVPMTFLPLAAIQFADQHIAVDLFVQLLPPTARRWLALAMSSVALVFTGWLTWLSFGEAFESFGIREVIETGATVMIMWPSRFVVATGIGLMVVVLVVQVVQQLRGRTIGDSDGEFDGEGVGR